MQVTTHASTESDTGPDTRTLGDVAVQLAVAVSTVTDTDPQEIVGVNTDAAASATPADTETPPRITVGAVTEEVHWHTPGETDIRR